MSTPSEYKTNLLNRIEEIFEPFFNEKVDRDRFEIQMGRVIDEWKIFKKKSIVSQIHDLSL